MELYVNFDIPNEAEEELKRYYKIVKGGDLSNVEVAFVARLSPEELKRMPKLRLIQVVLAGLDHLP